MRKQTHNEIVSELQKVNPNIEIMGICDGTQKPVHCKCKVCGFDTYPDGKEWTPRPNDLFRGRGCPACGTQRKAITLTKTHEAFMEEMSEKHPNIRILGKYEKCNIGIPCRCEVCGFDRYADGRPWEPKPQALLAGYGCPQCGGSLKLTHEQFIQKLSKINPNIEVLGKYINNKSKIKCRCKVCGFDRYNDGKEWAPQSGSLLSGQGCPVCSGRAILVGYNDLSTVNPMLAMEWNYDKNRGITPHDVTEFSNKRVWWKCSKCGHEWRTAVNNRAQGKGCSRCASELQTSFPEQAIYFYCNKMTKTINRDTSFGKEIDIYLPELHVGIEYSGSYWHDGKTNYDKSKIDFLKKNGIRVIAIKDGVENTFNENVIIHKDDSLDWAIRKLFEILKFATADINTTRDMPDIHNQYIRLIKENSFAAQYPELAKQWSYENNGSVAPDMVSAQSKKRFYRICPLCKNPYQIMICDWIHTFSCRRCAYDRNKGKNNPMSKQIYIYDSNGSRVDSGDIYTLSTASDVLNVSKSTVVNYLKSGKPFFKGRYKGCVLSHILRN